MHFGCAKDVSSKKHFFTWFIQALSTYDVRVAPLALVHSVPGGNVALDAKQQAHFGYVSEELKTEMKFEKAAC